MKKIISTSLFFLSVIICNAQISVGPKVGVNIMAIDYKNAFFGDMNSSSGAGLQAGAVVNIEIMKYFTIRPELVYNMIKSTASTSGSDLEIKDKLHYLSLPVNLVGTLELGPGKINVFAGPQISLLLGGKEKVGATNFGKVEYKIKGGKDDNLGKVVYFNPLHFGINVGAGYQLKTFLLTVQYTFGISNMEPYSKDSYWSTDRDAIKTTFNGFNVGVAYLFGGKKK